jgi:hypothetical protein
MLVPGPAPELFGSCTGDRTQNITIDFMFVIRRILQSVTNTFEMVNNAENLSNVETTFKLNHLVWS